MLATLRAILRFVVPIRMGAGAAFELVLLTAGAFWLGQRYSPDDPLFLKSEFHWQWLVPAILACRYGVFVGFASVTLLLALWWGAHGPVTIEDPFPKAHFLGGVLLIYVCGQFSEVWNTRLARATEAASYYQSRLDALSRNHYLLRLSHDRLLQDALAKPITLRDSLVRIRMQAMAESANATPKVDEFLKLVGHLCQIEVGAVHAIVDGKPQAAAIATLGDAGPLEVKDTLVDRAIETNALAHVQMAALRSRNPSKYLVCAPAADSFGAPQFFLAIERMPFMALTHEALQTLTVVLGYYADGFAVGRLVAPIHAALPEVPVDVALEVARLSRIARAVQIHSVIVALVFSPSDRRDEAFAQVSRVRRARDVTWEPRAGERRVLLTVMPLAGQAMFEGYTMRIERILRESVQMEFGRGEASVHSIMIDGSDPVAILTTFLERCLG